MIELFVRRMATDRTAPFGSDNVVEIRPVTVLCKSHRSHLSTSLTMCTPAA